MNVMNETQVKQFWAEVKQLLVEKHHISKQNAASGIKEYRRLLRNAGIGDTVFNRGEELAAESIAASLEMKLINKAPATT